jgi:GNAT superfamily N-acetyltransferase
MLIRLAQLQDAVHLPPIEKSAAKLFRVQAGLSWLADGPVISLTEHERLIFQRTVWVAESSAGDLVGFINAEVFGHDLHVWELSVHEAWQRMGIGKKLILSAYSYACEHGLAALTLTTFTDVPWCAPAYSTLGFQPVLQPGQRLLGTLEEEARQGLPMAQRLAMTLPIGMLTA